MAPPGVLGIVGSMWWVGVVEGRKDPLKMKRVQVRIFGWHTPDKTLIPTADLPWAMVPSHIKSRDLRDGAMVMGFFMDGDAAQFPIVTAAYPGIPEITPPGSKGFADQRSSDDLTASPRVPASRTYNTDGTGVTVTEQSAAPRYPDRLNEPTTSRLERNYKTSDSFVQVRKDSRVTGVATADGKTWDEPQTAYATVFPFNDVTESESGHIIEIDDTPGAERLNRTHRTGTFEEIGPDGSKVTKVVKNNYEILMGDDNVYVMGKVNLTVAGDVNLKSGGTVSIKADESIAIDAPGGVTITQGSLTVQGALGTQQGASGTFTAVSGDIVHVVNGIVVNIF